MNGDSTDQQDMTPDETMRAGFAALIGAPNAGKSTLMNAMVGQKVSIVTPKVQTTRSRIRGIAMHGAAQIILTAPKVIISHTGKIIVNEG